MAAQAKKYEKFNPTPNTHVHLLTTLIKCPLCGAGMYGNKATTRGKDGTPYAPSYYYACKHRRMDRGHKCEYKKQVPEKVIDQAVGEIIIKRVRNSRFAALMQDKINIKQLRQ